MNVRDYLQGDFDAVAFIDGTLFAVNESHKGLVSWSPGGYRAAANVHVGASSDEGTIDYFAVINDKLFFVYSGHDNAEDSQSETLFSVDADLNWNRGITNPVVIDTYQDWFA